MGTQRRRQCTNYLKSDISSESTFFRSEMIFFFFFFICTIISCSSVPMTETRFCEDCTEITISSSGGALQHLPEKMGAYALAGSLWENMMPFWKSASDQYITPDANSNPIIYYIKWVASIYCKHHERGLCGGGRGWTLVSLHNPWQVAVPLSTPMVLRPHPHLHLYKKQGKESDSAITCVKKSQKT